LLLFEAGISSDKLWGIDFSKEEIGISILKSIPEMITKRKWIT